MEENNEEIEVFYFSEELCKSLSEYLTIEEKVNSVNGISGVLLGRKKMKSANHYDIVGVYTAFNFDSRQNFRENIVFASEAIYEAAIGFQNFSSEFKNNLISIVGGIYIKRPEKKDDGAFKDVITGLSSIGIYNAVILKINKSEPRFLLENCILKLCSHQENIGDQILMKANDNLFSESHNGRGIIITPQPFILEKYMKYLTFKNRISQQNLKPFLIERYFYKLFPILLDFPFDYLCEQLMCTKEDMEKIFKEYEKVGGVFDVLQDNDKIKIQLKDKTFSHELIQNIFFYEQRHDVLPGSNKLWEDFNVDYNSIYNLINLLNSDFGADFKWFFNYFHLDLIIVSSLEHNSIKLYKYIKKKKKLLGSLITKEKMTFEEAKKTINYTYAVCNSNLKKTFNNLSENSKEKIEETSRKLIKYLNKQKNLESKKKASY